jgi:biopolymer transport protein ExbD
MNPIFEYLLKSTISLALFYIVFKLAVSRDKMHSVNRFVLLGILVTSAILPFADIPVLQENQVIPQIEVFSQMLEAPVLNNLQPVISEEIQTVQQTKTASINPFLLIYLFAIILLFIRLIISLVRVLQIIQKAEKQPFQNYILAVVKDLIHPFSFLRNIVISKKDYTENKEMVITHEYAHIKHIHAIDLIICELFTTIYWFNPFMWLLRRDLRLIHEYQADQAVLNKGIDASKYQLLVIEKAVGERRFAMANHFKQKPILKRIKMMKKKNLNQWTRMKLLAFIPIIAILLMAFSKEKLNLPVGENITEKVVQPQTTPPVQIEQTSLVVNIKNDGYYIDGKLCSLNEVVNQAKKWQEPKKREILLSPEKQVPQARVNEVRKELEDVYVIFINQQVPETGEIIYFFGDVSVSAKFKNGSWHNWMETQLKNTLKDNLKKLAYNIEYGFIIDKNGKVRDGLVIRPSEIPEINEAFDKILTQIPEWQPAKKGKNEVSVFYRERYGQKVVNVTNVVEKQ